MTRKGRRPLADVPSSSVGTSPARSALGAVGAWRMTIDLKNRHAALYPDAAMLRLLGLERDPGPSECHRHWVSRIVPEDRPKLEKMTAAMETALDVSEVEFRWRHPQWGEILLRYGGKTERSEDGIVHQSGYCRNITGLARLTDPLPFRAEGAGDPSRPQQQYGELFQSVLCGIVQYRLWADGHLRFVDANQEALRILGYTAEEFRLKNDWTLPALIAEEDRERILGEAALLRKAGDTVGFQYRLARKDGSPCWIVGTAEILRKEEDSLLVQSVFLDIDAHKRMESENRRLRQEKAGINEILRMALSGTAIAEFFYYPQERYALLPERLLRAYGFAPRYDNLPEGFSDIWVAEPDRPAYCGIYRRIDEGAPYASAEFRLRDGVTWLRLCLSVVQYSPQGLPEYAVGIVEDITLQRQAESEKNKLEQINKEVLYSLNEMFFGVYRTNITTGKVRAIRTSKDIHVSVGMTEETEYRVEEFAALYDPADRARYIRHMGLDNLRALHAGGQAAFTREYRRRFRTGYIWVACTVFFKETDQGVIAILAVTDITEHRKMSDVIRALSDEYYAVYYLNMHTGTYETLRRGASPQGRAIPLQGVLEEAVPLLLEQTPPEDQTGLNAFFQEVKSASPFTQKKISPIFREFRKEGTAYIQGTLIGDGSEKSDYAILAFRNVDQHVRQEIESRKLLRDALEQAESSSRAKSNFLSCMSHDIRTPMNAIIGMTTLAKAHRTDPEKLDDYFSKILLAGNHLLELLNEVLDMSSIESGKTKLENSPFAMDELLLSVVTLHQNAVAEKSQTLDVRPQGILHPHVVGDRLHIQSILNNILSNAHKYTPVGGTIRLTVEEIPGTRQVSNFRFTIEDTGIGMTEEFLSQIFEPFARAYDPRISRVHGTGLGMTIARNLARLMHGDILVESRPGRGSRFTVLLPLKLGENATPSPSRNDSSETPPEEDVDLTGRRLLLVEDNELNREIACALLESTGAQVETAENGKEAVEKFAASQIGYYALVLMDIQMPVMNGLDATRAIRALPRGDAVLPIVAVTANAFAEDVKASLAAGMNAHVEKPLDFAALSRTLAQWIFQ